MNVFKNFISIGYFCSVALELEKCGLRSFSSPLDWNITWSLKGVIDAINNHFEGFLDIETLEQEKECPEHYRCPKYLIDFYHDFDKYHSLKDQIDCVREKYNRRIENFYKSIMEPTLFVRYICSQWDGSEFEWIDNNYEYILSSIKWFNPLNNILFITSSDRQLSSCKAIYVKPDENDYVARHFCQTDAYVNRMFESFFLEDKSRNILFYQEKERKRNMISKRIVNKLKQGTDAWLKKEYIHDKTFNYMETEQLLNQ